MVPFPALVSRPTITRALPVQRTYMRRPTPPPSLRPIFQRGPLPPEVVVKFVHPFSSLSSPSGVEVDCDSPLGRSVGILFRVSAPGLLISCRRPVVDAYSPAASGESPSSSDHIPPLRPFIRHGSSFAGDRLERSKKDPFGLRNRLPSCA